MGLNFTFCDMSVPGALAAAIRPTTRLVWVETPTNPTMKITSIEVVAAAAHAVGAILVVDNTFASPYLQSPLALGADVVFHSVSKYIGGHSDLVMGALVTSDEALATRLRHLQVNMGGVPSPFDCFLASRGMKTLGLRMAAHGANGAAVAAVVEAHPAVRRVLYPGLPSHPSYDVAVAQMRGGGGMMTFWLDGGLPAARAFLGALSVVTLAVSLGGVESLVEHPALMTHAALPPAVRAELGIDDGMLGGWRHGRWGLCLGRRQGPRSGPRPVLVRHTRCAGVGVERARLLPGGTCSAHVLTWCASRFAGLPLILRLSLASPRRCRTVVV